MLTTRKFGEDEMGRSERTGGARGTLAKAWTNPAQSSVASPTTGSLGSVNREGGLRSGNVGLGDAGVADLAASLSVMPAAGRAAVLVTAPRVEPLPSLPLSSLHLLVVDDDDSLRRACCEIAGGMGFRVHHAESVPAARTVLEQHEIDLLLLDMKLPGGGGLALLSEVKKLYPEVAVLVMTAYATVSSAVEAMKIGASDYLTKPFAVDELTTMLERVAQRRQVDLESRLLREKLRSQTGEGHIIGNSPEMEKLYRILSKVAHSTHPVLILGESGTGKEMVARTIHANGSSAARPFVPVDCGSLAPTLIESELFGYVKGAFTGANRTKEGLLAAAEGGTVFLDEIGELPLDLQAKLLRALQEKEVRPVGATQAVPISARVLAATNRDLQAMVEQGKFRKDLYFRLNVVNLKIPPLRERRADIPVLVAHFLARTQRRTGRQHIFTDEAMQLMQDYHWPGNVRELENAIDRLCTLSSGALLNLADLPSQLQEFRLQTLQAQQVASILTPTDADARGSATDSDTALTRGRGSAIVSIAELEKQAILNTIRQLHGDKLMAARLLQIGKTTLYRKLKEYGISDGAPDAPSEMEEMN
jgi:DNA-binding NtrC family response regulator